MTPVDLEGLAEILTALPARSERYLIAIAGPPASGKSTLAEMLSALVQGSAVVPMDGFHLGNEVLEQRGLLARKGAPETFDAQSFRALMLKLRKTGPVSYPTFDREADAAVPGGGHLAAETHIVLVEGNYLLLERGDWTGLDWDISVFIDVPETVLEARLMQRWLGLGLPVDVARAKTHGNDLINASTVLRESRAADYALTFSGTESA